MQEEEDDSIEQSSSIFDSDPAIVLDSEPMIENSSTLLDSNVPNESENFEEQMEEPEPLYEGSLLSVPASNVLIYKFALKHHLSNEGLLKLIALHCPTPNSCVASVYLLKKFFGDSKLETKLYFFCGACYMGVEENAVVCPNSECGLDLTSDGAMSSFIQLSIEQQLQKILTRKPFT